MCSIPYTVYICINFSWTPRHLFDCESNTILLPLIMPQQQRYAVTSIMFHSYHCSSFSLLNLITKFLLLYNADTNQILIMYYIFTFSNLASEGVVSWLDFKHDRVVLTRIVWPCSNLLHDTQCVAIFDSISVHTCTYNLSGPHGVCNEKP